MNAKDAIRQSLQLSQVVTRMYLEDLGDADLLVRPAPSANHIAWQLGHVIAAEARFLKGTGGKDAGLPSGFDEKHTKETAKSDSPSDFLTKQEYMELFSKVRAATLELLETIPDAKLDEPNQGPMAKLAPTCGAVFLLIANHETMHTGQFTVVRRKLGKPVLF